MKTSSISGEHQGFALLTVLLVTAIGLLFGAGALLLFRYQCQMRIDRQQDLEKTYAVRSALNYTRLIESEIGQDGKSLRYVTDSGRDLNVVVKPVGDIFPDSNQYGDNYYPRRHLSTAVRDVAQFNQKDCSSWNVFPSTYRDPNTFYDDPQYNSWYDYEYGANVSVDLKQCITNRYVNRSNETRQGIVFTNNMDTAVKLWLNIGMRNTGGWLQENYGRRYFFKIGQMSVDSRVRLCIISNVTNKNANVGLGCKHGWPLSGGEKSLVLEVVPVPKSIGEEADEAKVNVYVMYASGDPTYYFNNISTIDGHPLSIDRYFGLQIAHEGVCFFQVDTYAAGSQEGGSDPASSAYLFSPIKNFYSDARYFAEFRNANGECTKIYDIEELGQDGRRLPAPELRAVMEVESLPNKQHTVLSDFRVMPAYQYDILIEHPQGITNAATVAQRYGTQGSYSLLTYDTHGTENRGFRKDEREAALRQSGQ